MAENSNIYMPLAISPVFTNRVQYILAQYAPTVLAEVSSVPASTHQARAALAQTVARSPASMASIFAVHLCTNVNVTSGGALTGSSSAGTLDTPATDASLFAAVNAIWNTVAGIVANP